MIRNLINENDFSLIKKTNSLYSIFKIIVFIVFIVICLRLFIIISNPKITKSQQVDEILWPILFDTNDNILAQTIESHTIQINNFHKINYKNRIKLIKDISVINPTKASEINETTGNSFYVVKNPSKNQISETIYLGNPEIKFVKTYKRNYPFNPYTKNLIGKMNFANLGQSLIEKYINNYNTNLKLSINIDLQKEASDILKKEVQIYDANYGFFILVDLLKEEIIINSYNANDNYLDKKFDDSVMPSISNRYQFGSVFKPITVYSALKNKVLDLDEYFDVTKPLKRFTHNSFIKDFFPVNEPLKTKDILKKSSNIGAVLIHRKLDCKKQFYMDLQELGLLKSAYIMKEIKTVKPKEPPFYTRKGDYCDNLAYGYALSVSPINLVNAYARIITGKMSFQSNIIKQKNFNDLKLNNISTEINQLLYYANESEHKLYRNCLVAGKTGTADDQSIRNISENGNKINNVTYMSYFPYNKPRYLSLTFMNHPKKSKSKDLTAGHTVKNSFYTILEQILFSLELKSCEKNIDTI